MRKEFYKGESLSLILTTPTPETGTRVKITDYTVEATLQGVSPLITILNDYQVQLFLSAETTAFLNEGRVDTILKLTDEDQVIIGKNIDLFAKDPATSRPIDGLDENNTLSLTVNTGDIVFEVSLEHISRSALKVWQDNGNPEGTEEEFLIWLQEPATEAASLANEKALLADEKATLAAEKAQDAITATQGAITATNEAIEATEDTILAKEAALAAANETLEVINATEQALSELEQLKTDTENIGIAVTLKGNQAEAQGVLAEQKATLAEDAATNALIKGNNAQTQADLANQARASTLAAKAATEQATELTIIETNKATQAAALAQEKATLANSRATLANQKADEAALATLAANQATEGALNAKAQALLASQSTQQATLSANLAADNANQAAEAEAELELLIAAAESARESAESLRISAESARDSAEGLRATGEDNRESAEDARVTAEGLRVSAEEARVTAEGLRVTAEEGRVTEEGLRVTAEQGRDTAEGLRVTAEEGRVTAEGLRVTAEDARVTAEAARVQAEIDRVNSGAALSVDVKAIQPAVAFLKRVTADGGTVVDKSLLAKFYTEMNQSLANTHALYFFQLGIKERVSGINRFCNKAYDMGPLNNDGVQVTEATQSFVGGYIAPNEFRCLKYLQGQTQTGEITIPTKSYLATDSWTLFLVLKANKRGTTRILTGANSYIDITATTIVLHNGTSATLTGTHTYDVGKIAQVEFQYSNGTGLIKVNNIPLATTVISTTMSITCLAYSSTNPFDGSIYYFHLENVRISESDSQKRFTFLRSLFAEIEGIGIGNQFWQTSNTEQTVAANGTVIPEVQLATSGAELLTLDFNNWTPVGTVTIDAVATFSTTGAGGVHKSLLTIGTVYLITFTKDNANCKLYNNAGTGATAEITSGTPFVAVSASIYFLNSETGTTVFSAASVKAAGWADLTIPAWCYYNNSVANGAVYGKLYNWYAIDLINKYAPQGFRVPSKADYDQLMAALGGTSIAGGKMKVQGLTYWNTPNTGATNESGFSALGTGYRKVDGAFSNLGDNGFLSTRDISAGANYGYITYRTGVNFTNTNVGLTVTEKAGMPIRLIRTSPTVPQRGVIRVSTTANIASTPVSIPIPFGCQVESIRIRNKQSATNLTSISATHNNTAGASLGTLITGKTVNAATSSIFVATLLDMASQETDGTIRILATGNAAEGCDIEVTYKAMAL